jgi:2-methylisocitrate lyase-like PEP mutase family enzyme
LECGIVHFPAVKKDPQGYASALTYARRYSLMAACGIAPEDDDGNSAARPAKTVVDSSMMADHITAIQDATDEPSLKAAYQAAYKACGTDANWQKKIIAVKDEKKASLK